MLLSTHLLGHFLLGRIPSVSLFHSSIRNSVGRQFNNLLRPTERGEFAKSICSIFLRLYRGEVTLPLIRGSAGAFVPSTTALSAPVLRFLSNCNCDRLTQKQNAAVLWPKDVLSASPHGWLSESQFSKWGQKKSGITEGKNHRR